LLVVVVGTHAVPIHICVKSSKNSPASPIKLSALFLLKFLVHLVNIIITPVWLLCLVFFACLENSSLAPFITAGELYRAPNKKYFQFSCCSRQYRYCTSMYHDYHLISLKEKLTFPIQRKKSVRFLAQPLGLYDCHVRLDVSTITFERKELEGSNFARLLVILLRRAD
jgi:hypothetical protein